MKKNLFVSVFILLISVVSLWACNPYKNFAMTLSDTSVNLSLTLNDDNTTYTGESKDVVVSITGGSKSVSKAVELPNSQYVNIVKAGESGGQTILRITAISEGTEDLYIRSSEGGLSQKLHIEVHKKLKSLSFVDSAKLVVEAGGQLDLAQGTETFLDFNPVRAAVRYEIVPDAVMSGYAYFEGSVLHAMPLSSDEEIYPTDSNGNRYITIKVISMDNAEIFAETQVYVAHIVNTQSITMNAEDSDEMISLTPNASGEYEIVLVPESIGGQSVDNYLSHRKVQILIGESSIDNENYMVNTSTSQFGNPNTDSVGFEYDSSSTSIFSFALTGITPGTVRKTIYVDHKDYVGRFTKAYTFVIKTINIPTYAGMRLNNQKLSNYTDTNPFVIFNGYGVNGLESTPFILHDVNVDNSMQFVATYDYASYGFSENGLLLTNERGICIVNEDIKISNNQSLYVKHNYESVDYDMVQVLRITYSYTMCPASGDQDDYTEHTVSFDVPILLKIGVTKAEVDSLSSEYFINSLNTTRQAMLTISSVLVASEQIAKVNQNNDLINITFEDNVVYVVSSAKTNQGTTILQFEFANGMISKEMTITTYIPISYTQTNTLYVTVDEGQMFAVGGLTLDDDENLTYYRSYEQCELNEDYPYETVLNVILPTNTRNIKFDVWNIYKDELDWRLSNANSKVLFSTLYPDYLIWEAGVIHTYGLTTTSIGAEGYPTPITFTLTLNGYVEGESITERRSVSVDHIVNVWLFDRITDTQITLGDGKLIDANTTGSKLDSLAKIEPRVLITPAKEVEDYGVMSSTFSIVDVDKVVNEGRPFISETENREYYVQLRDLIRVEDGIIVAEYNADYINAIAKAIKKSTQYVLSQLYGTNGLSVDILSTVEQFGTTLHSAGTVVVNLATKVSNVVLNGVGQSGLYFEIDENSVSTKSASFGYTIYPANATNTSLNAWLANGIESSYTITIDETRHVITLTLKDGMQPQDDVLYVNPVDNYTRDELGEDVVYNDGENLYKKIAVMFGDGTEEHKYQIRTVRDLQKAINDSSTSHYYALANDINIQSLNMSGNREFGNNLSGTLVVRLGDTETNTLHSAITGMYISKVITTSAVQNIGLFTTIKYTGVVSDLYVADASINVSVAPGVVLGGNMNIGILAGVNYGKVSGVKVTGEIIVELLEDSTTTQNINIGGMVGILGNYYINGENKSASINDTYLTGDDNYDHTNTDVSITFNASTAGNYNLGAIVGMADIKNTNNTSLKYVSVAGKIVANSPTNSVGGLVGTSKYLNIGEFDDDNNVKTDVLVDLYGYNVGGVVGTMLNKGSITNTTVKFAYTDILKNKLYATHTLGGLIGTAITTVSGEHINIDYSYVRSFTTRAIDESYTGALVLAQGGEFAGGLVGNCNSELSVMNSYFDADMHMFGTSATGMTGVDVDVNGNITSNDGIASVGGVFGMHSKGITVMYSYVKGRIIADTGNFGLISGRETTETYSDDSISKVQYDVAGNLSQQSIQGGDGFELTQTSTGSTFTNKRAHIDGETSSSSTVLYSYVALNNNLFAIKGVKEDEEPDSNYLSYKDADTTKTEVKIKFELFDRLNTAGLPSTYVLAFPSVITTVANSTGVSSTYSNLEIVCDSEMEDPSVKYIYRTYYKEDGSDYVRLVDGHYVCNFLLITLNSDSEIDYLTTSTNGTFDHSEDSGEEPEDDEPATDEEIAQIWLNGGYKISDTGELDYVAIKYRYEDKETHDIHEMNVTKADADAQLLILLNKTLNVASSYVQGVQERSNIKDAMDELALVYNQSVDVTGTKELDATNINFSDLNEGVTNYSLFSALYKQNSVNTVTTGLANIYRWILYIVLEDSENNFVARVNVLTREAEYNEDIHWMVHNNINGGMPVVLQPIGDIQTQSISSWLVNNTFANFELYHALYDGLPTISGETLKYTTETESGHAQHYYQLTKDSVMLMDGLNYTFKQGDEDSEASNKPIQINIDSATLAKIRDTFNFDRYLVQFEGYFVKLISNDEVDYISSNSSVLVTDNTTRTFRAVGTGNAVLSVVSRYDSSIRVDFNIVVVPQFDTFDLLNKKEIEVDSRKIEVVYADQTNTLYPTFIDNTSQVVDMSGGVIVEYVENDGFISINGDNLLYTRDDDGIYVLDGDEYRLAEPGDEDLPHYSRDTQDTLIIEDLADIHVKGLAKGTARVRFTPYVKVSPSTVGAEQLIITNGAQEYSIYVVRLEDLAHIEIFEVKEKAKSIRIIGQTTATRTPDSVVELQVEIVSYSADDEALVDLIDFEQLTNSNYENCYTLLSGNANYDLIDMTISSPTVSSRVVQGVVEYTYVYNITIGMSHDKFNSIVDSSTVGYINPMSNEYVYEFTFGSATNHGISATFTYTLMPNALTKFDVEYYPSGENNNGEFNPREVKSTKIVPGNDGLIKITPQRPYNNLGYIEITGPSNVRFVQVVWNGEIYTQTENAATIIDGGIRLWNINGVSGYLNTYYVWLRTDASLPQGQNITINITAYSANGGVIYSQDNDFVVEHLPYISALIQYDTIADRAPSYETFSEVALGSVTPVRYESAYLDSPASYSIKTTTASPARPDTPDRWEYRNYTSMISGGYITLARLVDGQYVPVSTNDNVLISGETYYVVVSKDYMLNKYSSNLEFMFVGSREIGGVLETTYTSMYVQVVEAKIGAVVLDGSEPDNGLGKDVFTIPTGYSSGLTVFIYPTVTIDTKANEDDKISIQRTRLNSLSELFSGQQANNDIYPFWYVKNPNRPSEDIQIDSEHSKFDNFTLSYYESVSSTDESSIVRCFVLEGCTRGQVLVRARLDYYFDESGKIVPFSYNNPPQVVQEGYYNAYYINYYFYINVVDGSTLDRPIPIETQADLEALKDFNDGNYILIQDITLENWEPFALNVDSLDGNSFRIYLSSFDQDKITENQELGLFTSIGSGNENTIVKNLTLDLAKFYNGGVVDGTATLDLTNLSRYNESTGEYDKFDVTDLSFGFFAVHNSGSITNCAVVNTNASVHAFTINTRQNALGTSNYNAKVAGFVYDNNGSISYSYVGKQVNNNGKIEVGRSEYDYSISQQVQQQDLSEIQTYAFDLYAGQQVAGFIINNSGTISNSYVKGMGVVNLTQKENGSLVGGFAGTNGGKIYSSFVEAETIKDFRPDTTKSYGWQLRSLGSVGGFVYENSDNGIIENAYTKMTIMVNSVTTGGFAYKTSGKISKAYTTVVNGASGASGGSYAHGPFVGLAWDAYGSALYGTLEYCYYLVLDDEFGEGVSGDENAIEILQTIDPAKPIMSTSSGMSSFGSNFQTATPFEGFSIKAIAQENAKDYLWYVNEDVSGAYDLTGPMLVGATKTTVSYRIYQGIEETIDPVTGEEVKYHKYSYNIRYNFGSENNPIVVYNPDSFIKSIVEYSKAYTIEDGADGQTLIVFGSHEASNSTLLAPSHIRVVDDINFNESTLRTKYYIQSKKTKAALSDINFCGSIEGNGMTLSGIKLSGAEQVRIENYGLFAQIGLSEEQLNSRIKNDTTGRVLSQYVDQIPRIFNINFEYSEVSNNQSSKVGVLAGSVYNAVLRMISISGDAKSSESQEDDPITVVSGWNMVGGIAGLIAGSNTNISDVTLNNIKVKALNNTITNVLDEYVNYSGYYDTFVAPQGGSATARATLINTDGYTITNGSNISYAGAIAGVILANNYKTFNVRVGDEDVRVRLGDDAFTLTFTDGDADGNTAQLRYDNGDIKNITVQGELNVVADQAGGMFGYIGYNTHIMDSKLLLEKTKEQNIFAYNYAGGIAGQMNSAVLERVEVRHHTDEQDSIDSKINKATPAMISTTTLFKSSDATSSNVSISIGGLAGYMTRGVIIDSYAKVNVMNEFAKVAGGLVGIASEFNYLGYAYTTGNVVGKEVIGGLVGLYTYTSYNMYLQNTYALNRWGAELIEKLESNYEIINDRVFDANKDKLVMPEVGNMYNGVGDSVAGNTNVYYFVGSVLGKATLLPGSYLLHHIFNRVESITAQFTIDNDGRITNNGYSIGMLQRRYELLPKYAKSLFVDDGNWTAEMCDDNHRFSLPLLMYKYNAGLCKVYDNITLTTLKESEYNQRVMDKSIYHNALFYNVFSTTYSVLTERVVNARITEMSYDSNSSNGSFALINDGMHKIYHRNNSDSDSRAAYIGNLEAVDGDHPKYKTTTYPNIIGKQTYLEMITGYYFSNQEDTGAKGYNYGYYKFANEFDSPYGFTKVFVFGESDTTPGTIIASKTWYKAPQNTVYFPEFSYGRKSSFIYLVNPDHAGAVGVSSYDVEFSKDNAGKFFYLQEDLVIDLDRGGTQRYNGEFSGIVQGGYTLPDSTQLLRRKITINADDNATLFEIIKDASFTNVDFVINLNSYDTFKSNGTVSSAYGAVARLVENSVFTECSFEVHYTNNSGTKTFTFTGDTGKNITDFGFVFGSATGLSMTNCSFGMVNDSNPSDKDIIIQFNSNSHTGNYGQFIGRLATSRINNLQLSTGYVSSGIAKVTFEGFSRTNQSITNDVVSSASEYGLNLGGVFGGVYSVSRLNNISSTRRYFKVKAINNFVVGTNQSVNIGGLAGLVADSSTVENVQIIEDMDVYDLASATSTTNGTPNIGQTFVTVGGIAGMVSTSQLINVKTYSASDVGTGISVNNVSTRALYVGGIAGVMDVSTLSGNNTDVRTYINVSNINWSETVSGTTYKTTLYVGGLVGASNIFGGTHAVDVQKFNATITSTIDGYIKLNQSQSSQDQSIVVRSSDVSKSYIGGIVGYAKYTNIINTANMSNMGVSNGLIGELYVGGIAGIYDVPHGSGQGVLFSSVLAYGHMTFAMNANTAGSKFGGLIGHIVCSTRSNGNVTNNRMPSMTVADVYSYEYMDYVKDVNLLFNIYSFDIICPDYETEMSSVTDPGVVYIREMMPVRDRASIQYGLDYSDWNKTTQAKYPTSIFSSLDYLNTYINASFGENASAGSIFDPYEVLSTLSAAEENKVYYVSTVGVDSTDSTIAQNAMIIGRKITGNYDDVVYYAPLINNEYVSIITIDNDIQYSNNGIISGFAIKLGSDRTKSLFNYNNGKLYNIAIYGDIRRVSTTEFASVASINRGSIANANVSVTIHGEINRNFSGLVFDNIGAIRYVSSTSGGLGLGDEYFVQHQEYSTIANTNSGNIMDNVLFAGVMKYTHSAGNITICSTTTSGSTSVGATFRTYEQLVDNTKTGNNYTNKFVFTDSGYWAYEVGYNFGVPYVKSAPKIGTKGSIISDTKTLYNYTVSSIVMVPVRTLADIIQSNLSLGSATEDSVYNSTSYGRTNYYVTSNINLADYAGKWSGNQTVIRFNKAAAITGDGTSGRIFDGNGITLDHAITSSVTTSVADYKFSHINVTGASLLASVSYYDGIMFDSISINAGEKTSYIGLIGELNSSSNSEYLTANNITIDLNGKDVDYVGLIGYSSGVKIINNTTLTGINIRNFKGGYGVGGLLGMGGTTTISNLTASNINISGSEIKGASFIGGITGYALKLNNVSITKPSSDVSNKISLAFSDAATYSYYYIGGLAGETTTNNDGVCEFSNSVIELTNLPNITATYTTALNNLAGYVDNFSISYAGGGNGVGWTVTMSADPRVISNYNIKSCKVHYICGDKADSGITTGSTMILAQKRIDRDADGSGVVGYFTVEFGTQYYVHAGECLEVFVGNKGSVDYPSCHQYLNDHGYGLWCYEDSIGGNCGYGVTQSLNLIYTRMNKVVLNSSYIAQDLEETKENANTSWQSVIIPRYNLYIQRGGDGLCVNVQARMRLAFSQSHMFHIYFMGMRVVTAEFPQFYVGYEDCYRYREVDLTITSDQYHA